MAYTLARARLGDWLKKIADGKTLVAPVAGDQGRLAFTIVKDPGQVALRPGVVPEGIKRWLYPPSEQLFRYTGKGPAIRAGDDEVEAGPLVLFGVRPCDALAVSQSDRFWDADFGDPYYRARRDKSLLISVNCDESDTECFCESIASAMSQPRGMDILLTPMGGDEFLVEGLTDSGNEALQASADLLQESDADTAAVRQEVAAKVAEQQKRRIESEGLTEAIQAVFGDADFWRKHTRACVGCGVCTFLCPTCTCFDVMDDAIGPVGYRYRCWDTCQFRQFCEEASGHDRRPEQWQRQRQRIGHKLWYSVDRFGEISCVGCGRCVKLCPVNIDISRIAGEAQKIATTEAEA